VELVQRLLPANQDEGGAAPSSTAETITFDLCAHMLLTAFPNHLAIRTASGTVQSFSFVYSTAAPLQAILQSLLRAAWKSTEFGEKPLDVEERRRVGNAAKSALVAADEQVVASYCGLLVSCHPLSIYDVHFVLHRAAQFDGISTRCRCDCAG
jgi:hypothetical protein